MPRDVPEWIGKDDDAMPPPRVRIRTFERYGGECQCGCGIDICGKPWAVDHKIAVINGGKNRESNLVPILTSHHKIKTVADLKIKSKTARIKAANLGVKSKGRPMPGSKASGWKHKLSGEWVKRDE
jgi:5-methylcytosine-specific restriction endonuclease McrA